MSSLLRMLYLYVIVCAVMLVITAQFISIISVLTFLSLKVIIDNIKNKNTILRSVTPSTPHAVCFLHKLCLYKKTKKRY